MAFEKEKKEMMDQILEVKNQYIEMFKKELEPHELKVEKLFICEIVKEAFRMAMSEVVSEIKKED